MGVTFFVQCAHDMTTHYGLTISLFLAGLVGSFTHCTSMCAPFVIAQTQKGPLLQKATGVLLLPYHLGRMTTYVALGVILQGFVNLAYLFSDARALISVPLLVLAGIMFLVSAFPQLGLLFPWAIKINLPKPFLQLITSGSRLLKAQNQGSRYALGVLLGFMPCGLLIAALMAAATATTMPAAALAMIAFTLGTMPILMIIGISNSRLRRDFPIFSQNFSRIAMTVSSLWLFALAGSLIF